jgi:hypothetical protein
VRIQPGTILKDRYEILRQIGEGGFATVFQARDLQLSREPAIKVLKTSCLTDYLPRFRREAQVLGQLQHKNILSVFAFDILEDGTPFMVMEFLRGQSLETFLDSRKKLNQAQMRLILKQICEGLSYAHRAGVVHRDLSLSNVQITGEDPDLTVKILDFGLSRLLGAEVSTGGGLTATGFLVGSLSFMSPEQSRGEKVDARSDIYSLGCLLYQCLCGRPAFAAEESPLEAIYKQQHFFPPEPDFEWSDSAGEKLFKDITLRCLQKDASKRFSSCDQIVQALSTGELPASETEGGANWADARKAKKLKSFGRVVTVVILIAGILGAFAFSSDFVMQGLEKAVTSCPGQFDAKNTLCQFFLKINKPLVAADMLRLLGFAHLQRHEYEKAAACHLTAAESFLQANDSQSAFGELGQVLAASRLCSGRTEKAAILKRVSKILTTAQAKSSTAGDTLVLYAELLEQGLDCSTISKSELRHWFVGLLRPSYQNQATALKPAVMAASRFMRLMPPLLGRMETEYLDQLIDSCQTAGLENLCEELLNARIAQTASTAERISRLEYRLAECIGDRDPCRAIKLLRKARSDPDNYSPRFLARTFALEAELNFSKRDFAATIACCNRGLICIEGDLIQLRPRIELTVRKIVSLYKLNRIPEMEALSRLTLQEFGKAAPARDSLAFNPTAEDVVRGSQAAGGPGSSPREILCVYQLGLSAFLAGLLQTRQEGIACRLLSNFRDQLHKERWSLEPALRGDLTQLKTSRPELLRLKSDILKEARQD